VSFPKDLLLRLILFFISIFTLLFSFLIFYPFVLPIHGPYIFGILTPHPEAQQSFLSFMDRCTDILVVWLLILLRPHGSFTKALG
jgi:hypothetical protein